MSQRSSHILNDRAVLLVEDIILLRVQIVDELIGGEKYLRIDHLLAGQATDNVLLRSLVAYALQLILVHEMQQFVDAYDVLVLRKKLEMIVEQFTIVKELEAQIEVLIVADLTGVLLIDRAEQLLESADRLLVVYLFAKK